MRYLIGVTTAIGWLTSLFAVRCDAQPVDRSLEIEWANNILIIQGDFPGKQLKTWYLEAYCRPNSHETDWSKHTVVGHQTRLVEATKDKKKIRLQCKLKDGVIVDHTIKVQKDNIDFQLIARNPTDKRSLAHWAQPCIRVGGFTGLSDSKKKAPYDYLKKSFVFQNGLLQTMPTKDWATQARYTPGQVWRAPNVKAADVNPRPLNPNVPDYGLIGCFGKNDRLLMATAWEPYQELFQGVITCLHSDFRIGGLNPGEQKKIKGKIYILANDTDALLKRYKRDFQK
jgi:hypothetical protein